MKQRNWRVGRGIVVVVLALCIEATPASADPITTEVYRSGDPTNYSLWSSPTTWYLEFEAMQTVVLRSVAVFGQPNTTDPLSVNEFRWQLFQTTNDWQTPNGNGDRLFYASTVPQNLGLSDYVTPVADNLVLQQGSFYRLSLQVVGPDDWLMQWHANVSQQSFLTSDGLFNVFGYGDGTVGPLPFFTNTWSLETERAPAAVPEPATLLLLGTGLVGAVAARRRLKR